MVAQRCLVTVRPLVIFLAWVLSRENNKCPRHQKRAVATTPSRAKRSGAAPSLCSGQAPSLCSGQGLKNGATGLAWVLHAKTTSAHDTKSVPWLRLLPRRERRKGE